MNHKLPIVLIALISLSLLTACAGIDETEPSITQAASSIPATETPVHPTPTETSLPFTATEARPIRTPTRTLVPTRTPVLATSAEDILGLWFGIENRDGMYFQFNADGTCQQATVRDSIDTNPLVRCTFYFEGTYLYITITYEDSSLPSCPSDVAIYQVQILDRDTIEFIEVDDTCTPRARSIAQIHERR